SVALKLLKRSKVFRGDETLIIKCTKVAQPEEQWTEGEEGERGRWELLTDVGFRKTAVESDHCPDAVVINLGHWMDELANIKRLWGRWESTRLEEGDDIGVANNLPMGNFACPLNRFAPL